MNWPVGGGHGFSFRANIKCKKVAVMAVLSWRQNKKHIPSGLDFCLDFLVNVLTQLGQSRTRGIELLAAGKCLLVSFV